MRRHKRIVLAVLAVLLAAVGAAFAYAAPMLSMTPAATGAVNDTDMLALRCGPNSLYCIPAQDGWIVVDAGSNAATVAQGLPEIGVDPAQVAHVLLTHSDSDHVGALALFPTAQIYMGADELQMLDGTTKRNAVSRNALPEGFSRSAVLPVRDGQVLALGGREVVAVSAPGHTPGSTAFLVDSRFLFTGDALRVKDGAMLLHPYTMDRPGAQESIRALAARGSEAELVLTAHYGWFRSEETNVTG